MRNRFRTIHPVLHYTGLILVVLGLLLLAPLPFVVFAGELKTGSDTLVAFLAPSGGSIIVGLIMRRIFREGVLYRLRAVLVCSLGWIACSAVGAIPYVLGIGAGYLDAYFETMSGFTTTGITMLSGLDDLPRSILFWRSLTQWLGGLGILGFFLAVAYRGGGAHRLFGAESHKIEMARPVPGLAHTIKILWLIYTVFTGLIFVGLVIAGMPAFDGLCHSFTALSTGGFSPHDASIEFYRLNGYPRFVLMEYILIIGMLLGGINFLVHYRLLTGRPRALTEGVEMKYLWGILGAFAAIMLAERYLSQGGDAAGTPASPAFWKTLENNFRIVLFQLTSILTTTGFGTRDIASPFFGPTARLLFLTAMLIGGCVGSTGGGIKILRVAILTKLLGRELFRLRSPRSALATVFIDGKPVSADEIQRVGALFFTWIVLLAVGGVVTAILSRHDGLSSVSGMFSALGNIGPCFIPVGEMALLNPVIKIVYIIGMLAGRLEILPVLILLNPRAWQY